MIEAIIIAGTIAVSAILIYVGMKSGLKESKDIQIRRMARTLVRSVEQRAEWDITLNSRGDKWARIVLVLQDKFDVEDDWLHIIIGEAQFDMEADNVSNSTRGSKTDPGWGTRVDQGRSVGSRIDDGRHPDDSGDHDGRTGRAESLRGTEHFDSGEDLPIPVAE